MYNNTPQERLNFNDIKSLLANGMSIEDIGNEFAKQLNIAKEQYDKDQETYKHERQDNLAEIIENIFLFLSNYYPSLINIFFPKDTYDCDKMAETICKTLDNSITIFNDKELMKILQELEEINNPTTVSDKKSIPEPNKYDFNDFVKMVDSYISR